MRVDLYFIRCSCLVDCKKGSNARSRPTFVCDVPDLSFVCETRGESYTAPVAQIYWPRCTSATPPSPTTKEGCIGGAGSSRCWASAAVMFYLIYESQAPRSSTFKKEGPDSFICMPRNPVRIQFDSSGARLLGNLDALLLDTGRYTYLPTLANALTTCRAYVLMRVPSKISKRHYESTLINRDPLRSPCN